MLETQSVKKNIFTHLFNYLYKKNVLGLAIALFTVIGLTSWFYLRSTIQKNISFRLDQKIDNISSTIVNRLNDYAITLIYVDAYFKTDGFPNSEWFKNFIQHIEAERVNLGIQDVGYIEMARGQKISAPITMHKTLTKQRSPITGYNMMANKIGKDAILAAISSAKITISKPRSAIDAPNSTAQQTVTLLLPYYGSDKPPSTRQERHRAIKGLIYIPVHMNDFFEANFGKAHIENENVNFKLEAMGADSKNQRIAYERFKIKPNYKYRESSKIIDLYGRRWKLTVSTLPSFFNFGDRYFVGIVGVTFILFTMLLMAIFYQTHNLLVQETKANTISEDSYKVKMAFLSNMSHEIRTPLNAINGFSKILAHTDNEREKHYLIESIRKNSMELTTFIDNILDISKVEFGRIYISKKRTDLISLIEKIKETMETRARAKGLLFEIESVGKLPARIQADEGRLRQILINLIGNAIKFTEYGYIKLQIEANDFADGQTHLMFTVIDTGIGISVSNQLELFQSFSQADISNTRRYGGIGLGLALSRRLAKQLDGDVTLLTSQLGKGSTFRLRVPCGSSEDMEWKENLFAALLNPSIQLDFLTEANLNKKKILIVEDAKDNQEIFQYFLTNSGAYSDIAENGQIAVEKIKNCDYDLVLMDIQMPIMDGLEATRKIRAMGFQKPIIALTAHASVEAKMNCLKIGCDDLITKPVTQETLIQKILFTIEEKKNVIENYNT